MIKYIGFDRNEEFFIKTDSKRLKQVILNLFSNAIKFTDRKGNIIIMIEKMIKEGENLLAVSIIDSGIGIEEEKQDKLFNLFCSMKDQSHYINTQGIGLGLVISKLIVEKFHGSIDFFSKHTKGSAFFFSFEIEEFDNNELSQFKST